MLPGCVTVKKPPEKEKIHYYRPPALSFVVLNDRIDKIKKMLEENSLSDDRKETAISILNAYDNLKMLNKENLTEKDYRKTVQLLFNTLVMLEQEYLYSGIIPGEAAGEIVIDNYSSLKKEILEAYFAGDWSKVITGCDDLISRFGKSGLTTDLGIILVEALSKSNMTSDALVVAKSIMAAVETKPDLIHLLAETIELEIKSGNIENARHLYEKLIDNINERNSLYQKTGKLLSEDQEIGVKVEEEIPEMSPEKIIQMEQLMDEINRLISQKDFSGARVALYKWRIRAEEGPELEMIEKLLKSVDKAEDQFKNKNDDNKLIIDDAKRLIEEEKYEEALKILEPIALEDGNYEAKKSKKEAIEKLILRDKNIAAKLKIAADKENDLSNRRDLLLKARSIFQNLIDKYPASPSIERVKRNISVVDEELMKLPLGDE